MTKMTVDGFLAWSAGREGHFELEGGEVISICHALTKMRAVNALDPPGLADKCRGPAAARLKIFRCPRFLTKC